MMALTPPVGGNPMEGSLEEGPPSPVTKASPNWMPQGPKASSHKVSVFSCSSPPAADSCSTYLVAWWGSLSPIAKTET